MQSGHLPVTDALIPLSRVGREGIRISLFPRDRKKTQALLQPLHETISHPKDACRGGRKAQCVPRPSGHSADEASVVLFWKKKVAAWAANGSSPGTQAAAIALPCLALPWSTQPCGSSARSLLFDDVTLFIAPQSGLETASVCIEKKRRRVSFFSFRCNRDCALLTTSVLESLHLTPRRGNSGFAIITVISLQSRCHVDRRILTGTRLASLSWSKGVGP